jgi:formylglycine-generating enzyme required for sulfatase activity
LTPTPYAFYATSATTANGVSGSLAGDVTGTQGATVVGSVGGQSAANIASGVQAANAATSAAMPNAIVQRDATGSFAATNVTVSGILTGNGGGLTNLNTTNLSGTLPAAQLSGTVADARLSPNVALRAGGNTFTGDQIVNSGNLTLNNGNVGIGTTTPQAKLEVNGDVMAGTFHGDGSGLTNVTAATLSIPPGMALIPAGTFTMGDTLDGELDAIPVTVTMSAFYMDVNLVSYSQWLSVYFWATNNGYGFDHAGSGKAANHPVQTFNWYDCVKWCNARSEQAGLAPVYYYKPEGSGKEVYRTGEVDAVLAIWTANGYRLPTEAEWEKAARGGLSGQRFPWGNVITENLANYYGDTADYSYDLGPNGCNTAFTNGGYPYTSPLGYFAPNGYGLYDMAGNVFEWCWDWYGTPYAGGTDPRGPASGSYRVLRGGGWSYNANICRTAYRNSLNPTGNVNNRGFRSVLPSGQ